MIHQTLAHPPDHCRIDVLGDLTPWKGRLGQLRMSSGIDHRYGKVTSLRGPAQDQADLFGILNTIYELHLPLLLFRALPGDTADEEDDRFGGFACRPGRRLALPGLLLKGCPRKIGKNPPILPRYG